MSKVSRWPRVLVVSSDPAVSAMAQPAMRAAGFEVHQAEDLRGGLKTLAATAPEVLLIDLHMPEDGGQRLIRRVRDDYVGKPPRVAVLAESTTAEHGLAALGCELLVLKPATEELMQAVVAGARSDRGVSKDFFRELLRLSLLSANLETALQVAARRLTRLLRVAECHISARLGEEQVVVSADGQAPGEDDPVWEMFSLSRSTGLPVVASGPGGKGQTVLSIPLETGQGTQLGAIMFRDPRPRNYPRQLMQWLRDLGQRMCSELAWLAVHQRIALDRDRLLERSMHDPLTGLLARAALDQQLPREVADWQERHEPVTFVILDVCGMRDVNHRLGHAAGDALLKHIATMLSRTARSQDLLARYGGDRFAVVLPGVSLQEAIDMVERLQKVVRTPLEFEDQSITAQVIAGVSPLMGSSDFGGQALRRAAAAGNLAKKRKQAMGISEVSDVATAMQPSDALESGATLGGMYQVLHEISRGAMGIVYRAEDLGLGRHVALKTLRPDLARDKKLVELFRREASTLAKIRHPNLVQVYAFGLDQEHLFFVMELVEGVSMEDRVDQVLDQNRHVPMDEVRAFVVQVAGALDTMHDAGIRHRDVKPANILWDRHRDRAVLVDVGIATGEETGAPAGTPGFAAPEVFRGARQSPATDVYGLAATAYAVMVGELPFGAGTENVLPVLHRQAAGPPKPASSLRASLPAAVDAVLARGLEPEAADRYPRASEFAEALIAALAGLPSDVERGTDPALGAADVALEQDGRERGLSTTWLGVQREAARVPAPDVAVPMTRGVVFRAAHEIVVSPASVGGEVPTASAKKSTLLGAGWLQRLVAQDRAFVEAFGPTSRRYGWYPTETLTSFLESVAANGYDSFDFARKLGFSAAAATFVAFFGADPQRVPLADIFSATDVFWHRYHSWGQIHVEHGNGDGIRIVIAGSPAHAALCWCTLGMLDHIVQLSGLSAKITHPSCQANGADACVFRVVPVATAP